MQLHLPKRLTIEELLALTTIATCEDCGLDHAPIRDCEEARLEKELNR